MSNTNNQNASHEWQTENMTFVLFGATGDLAKRKLFPALYNLYVDNKLPTTLSIVCLGRGDYCDTDFLTKVEDALTRFSRRTIEPQTLQKFLSAFRYCKFDATNEDSYRHLNELIQSREQQLSLPENRLFYLSVAPTLIERIATGLDASGINHTAGWKRLIVEKPFGNDLKSAQQLNKTLSQFFHDDEVYRIDHFLGKPIVQNLTSLVSRNPVFNSLLTHENIANVQITAFETVGVETRAEFYDEVGALLDMVQNHLLQLVMMTALHLPEQATAQEIRAKKVAIMKAIRSISKEDVAREVVRGQYEAGTISNESVLGYKEEPGVSTISTTDTYFAARLYIDNAHWKDIPFYIRTGKRTTSKSTKIVIEFKTETDTPNLLVIDIGPHQGLSLTINVKNPTTKQFEPATLTFQSSTENEPEAYELLLFDACVGNATFFANWQELELSWQWIQPILETFQQNTVPLAPYIAGSNGPIEATELIQQQQFTWW